MALSQAQQQALNTATPGTQFAQLGTAVGTLQANTQTGAKAFAAGGSRVTNTTTPTPFPGGALSLPANLAQGTIIRGNYFHDIRGTDARFQNAVYLDDMASGILVEQNLFAECNWGILAGGGRDLMIRDNAFLACGKAISYDSRGTGWKIGRAHV